MSSKVGLLNIFDCMTNVELEDYFRVNTISEVGSMQYATKATGSIVEYDVTEAKHIVPVIAIDIHQIRSGTGSVTQPYKIG